MKILLFQLDGKLPNVALMRIASRYKGTGCEVVFRKGFHQDWLQPQIGDNFDMVFGSAIFKRSRHLCDELKRLYPYAIVGGTGSGSKATLEERGIGTEQDYSIYPKYRHSIGFTQRGCRSKCSFCMVPQLEGKVRDEQTVTQLWRGDPWPRNLLLLDNDFFGQKNWDGNIKAIHDGGFKVSFNQGINVRMIGEEEADAIASVDYRDDDFKVKRIYTAWDNAKDATRLFRGLNLLRDRGVKPDNVMVYMLIGYWPGETHEDREMRRVELREFGCRPYPMPYVRTPELIGYQRWVIRRIDLMLPWEEFKALGYRPEKISK